MPDAPTARALIRVFAMEAWRSLIATRSRTLLALIGIMVGIGAVVAMVTIGQIIAAEIERQFRNLGVNLVSTMVFEQSGSAPLFDRLQEMEASLFCTAADAPFSMANTAINHEAIRRLLPPGEDLRQIGVTDSFARAADLEVAAGRFISRLDGSKPYVVLGHSVSRAFGGTLAPADLIGQSIEMGGEVMTIVGVIGPGRRNSMTGIEPDLSVFVPYNFLDVPAGMPGRVLSRVRNGYAVDSCVTDIRTFFQRRGNYLLRSSTSVEVIEQMQSQADLIGLLLAAVAGIALVIGGVGIMNIMLMSLAERRQEIGVRRALGATRRHIQLQFMIEAVMLSLAGGVMGVILAVAVVFGICWFNEWPFQVSIGATLLGSGVAAVIGVVFGFLPARQAARMSPIDALRQD